MLPRYEQYSSTLTVTYNQRHHGYPIRFHTDLEILFLEAGSLEMLIDGIRYSLKPGELCVVFPNIPHSILAQESSKYLVMVSPALLPEYAKLLAQSKPVCPVLTAAQVPEMVGPLCRRCAQLYPEAKDRGLLTSYVGNILGEILRVMPLRERNSDTELVQRIVECVITRYSEDISLEQLAEELGYSKFYISHCINDTFGCNFRSLVNNYRINAAEGMLLHSRRSISEVAFACGFGNLSSFNRAFLKYCGVSPSAYRKARLS